MASSLNILATLSLISLLFIQPSFSQTTCKSKTLVSNTTFANCNDLPTLNATLHWTYDQAKSSLSMAFTAPPPSAQGWVAWAINPKGLTMFGSQSLIAFKPNSSASISVNTYDIQTYVFDVSPLSYKVTNLSAQESNGEITIFATWALPTGTMEINQIWQVGPVSDGHIGKHESAYANLNAMMKLSLTGGPVSSPSPTMGSPPTTAPPPVAGGQPSGAIKGNERSIIMGLVLLVVSFFVTL